MATLIRKLKNLRYRLFYGLLLRRAELTTLCGPGSICPWTFCPTGLNATSVVYSGGVGSDITFEHELVKKYNCHVVLCDPSPMGLKTMSLSENQIPQFHFFPVALAGHSGTLKIASHPDSSESWYVRQDNENTVEIPCTDLRSLMQRNGHTYIDLLKIDIEGCEYAVIDDILKRRLPVQQICADFDYGCVPGVRRRQAIRAIFKLLIRGYQLVDRTGQNHTFLHDTSHRFR